MPQATFEYLSIEQQNALLKAMAQEDVAALLNNMAPDERTRFLEELPASATRQLLALLTPGGARGRGDAARLSRGIDRAADDAALRPGQGRVDHPAVLDHIRRHGQDSETLNVIYVVDDQGVLIDDIHIRELLLADPANRVRDLMDRRFVA